MQLRTIGSGSFLSGEAGQLDSHVTSFCLAGSHTLTCEDRNSPLSLPKALRDSFLSWWKLGPGFYSSSRGKEILVLSSWTTDAQLLVQFGQTGYDFSQANLQWNVDRLRLFQILLPFSFSTMSLSHFSLPHVLL